MWQIDEIETPLDAIQPRLYRVESALDTSLPFFEIRRAKLDVAHGIVHAINFFVDAP
jgi:hypothetical protein